jgi:adenylylsulfate kinase
LVTALIAYGLTHDFKVATLAGGIDGLSKVILYFIHERLWNKIHYGKRKLKGKVIWITGIPASGKTTLAKALSLKLTELQIPNEILDGDEIRAVFPETGFDPVSRNQHVRRVAHLASVLEKHEIWTLVSLVSPYRESRDFARALCKDFVEVYLNPPLSTCQKRDPKKLYQSASQGSLKELTGLQSPYEPPLSPQYLFDTEHTEVQTMVTQILKTELKA